MSVLFEKIGGRKAVEAAVDIFYTKVLGDPSISHFFESVDMKAQKGKQTAFLTFAFGGPNNYTGKDMRNAHKHMKLTEAHFSAVAAHLQSTLEELSVPKELIQEVMSIAASTHDDVLNL